MTRSQPYCLDEFPYTLDVQTRWHDNDVYGHINNVVYYTWFDTVVNTFLIEKNLLEIGKSKSIGLVVDTGCQYFSSLSFPQTICAGLRVKHIGNSSVRYEIGVFGQNATRASAQGHFVHVYVDAHTHKPQPISQKIRSILENILV